MHLVKVLYILLADHLTPKNVRAVVGDEVILICRVSKGTTTWRFNQKDITAPNVIIIEGLVIIDPIELENQGMYECFGKSPGDEEFFIAKSDVVVVGEQKICSY